MCHGVMHTWLLRFYFMDSWSENRIFNSSKNEEGKRIKMENEKEEQKQTTIPGLQVGIDLGTTNSTVAYFKDGKIQFLEVRHRPVIPSAIFFAGKSESDWQYGDIALRKGILYPDALFSHFKRYIGKQEKKKISYSDTNNGDSLPQVITYVIDTNVFLDAPFILDSIEKSNKIIIPKTVFEELSYNAQDNVKKEKAETAIEEIHKREDEGRIVYADSKIDLLPDDDMFKKAVDNHNVNDNKIISIAIQYNNENTVLLTSDKGIKTKVGWLKEAKFVVKNLEEYEFEKNIYNKAQEKEDNTLSLSGKDGAVIFLKYLRSEMEKQIGHVTRAVITVPQKFSPIQTSEIREAGIAAGFDEVEVHPEPIAAAVAYGMDQVSDKTILVYDFGGGTFDVAIIRKTDDDFYPIAADGDPELGGEDFTKCLMEDVKEWLLDEVELDMNSEEDSGLPHDEFVKNEQRIWNECENMKCALSDMEDGDIRLNLYVTPGEQKELIYSTTRDEFDHMTDKLRAQAKKSLDNVLKQADLKREDIDAVIMAGGTSTIPSIRETVEHYFGQKPYADKNPATLIAEGAAVFADLRWNQDTTIEKKIQIYEQTMEDFGVSLKGRIFDCIIPAGTALPVRNPKLYSLVKDNQEELNLEIFTRDKGSTATSTMENSIQCVGRISIKDLPPMKIDEVNVEVTFEITKEYVLNASVRLLDMQNHEVKQAGLKIEKAGV